MVFLQRSISFKHSFCMFQPIENWYRIIHGGKSSYFAGLETFVINANCSNFKLELIF